MKEIKIYDVVFSLNKKPYRKPVCGLIPGKQRINHWQELLESAGAASSGRYP